ncbi:MAG: T9SS type A sorting domain-containing protein [Chitinophagaceae bacterium]|nr:T9SS type A sorting domain-containing protein [Chitinophagaceae bacterium]
MERNLLLRKSKLSSHRKLLTLAVCFSVLTGVSFGQAGQSLNYDPSNGNNAVIYIPTGTDVIGLGSYTKEAWIRMPAIPMDNKAYNILSQSTGASALYVYNGQLSSGQNPSFPAQVTDPTVLSPNTWYHVAVTYDGTTHEMILYKNGVQVASGTSNAITTPGYQLAIGAIYSSSVYTDFTFYGDIDEVRVWNYVQSASEIQGNYQCTVSKSSPGLLAYFQFNQGIAGSDNTGITTLIDSTGNGNDATLGNFTLNGPTSNFTAASAPLTGDCIVAPVKLISFDGRVSNNLVQLIWSTSTEINNAGFEIQRSANGNTGWEKIGFVAGYGNSVEVHNYNFTDNNPINGTNYYRLLQTDWDGNATYSNIISFKIGNAGLISIYPTIARSAISIVSNDASVLNKQFIIVNNSGKLVQNGVIQSNKQSIDVSSLSSGVYFVRIQGQSTLKFIKE